MTEEEQELVNILNSLRMESFRGALAKCPRCKRNGYFGSIINYKTQKGNDYIICSWCGNITKGA